MSSSDSGPGGGGRPGTNSLDPLIGRILLERYEVLRKIGSGGMGAVYIGKQLAVGREVALKILRADLISNEAVRERFRREAAIIGKLRHPNTIQLIDYGETDDGLAIIVCELLVGLSLSDRLRQLGPMPMKEAIEVACEVASSLAEAHSLGMVHRDLKPANIFLVEVTGKTHAKVLDFGIARVLDEESTRITSTGQVFGTPRYMSPEQGMATGEVDRRADIYSLGLILFECLVGQPPFVANTSIQYLSAHMTLPPPKLREHLPNAPDELDRVIDACLIKDRELRIQTAEEVERVLKRVLVSLEQNNDTSFVHAGGARTASSLSGAMAAPITPPLQGATTGFTTGVPTVAREPIGKKPALLPILAGVALLAAAGVASAAYYLNSQQDPVTVAGYEDAGAVAASPDAAAVVIADPPDSGAAVVAVAEEPDAGFEDAAPAVVLGKNKTKTKGKRKGKDEGVSSVVGGITGPRAMWIPNGEGDDGPAAMAKACKSSQLSGGSAKLTLKPCPKNCAVIIDGTCAGRTPTAEQSVPEGNKNVTVVCGGAVVVDQIAKLRPGETTVLSCR